MKAFQELTGQSKCTEIFYVKKVLYNLMYNSFVLPVLKLENLGS